MAPKKAAPAKKTTASKTTAAKATAKKAAPAKAAKKATAKPVAKKPVAKKPVAKKSKPASKEVLFDTDKLFPKGEYREDYSEDELVFMQADDARTIKDLLESWELDESLTGTKAITAIVKAQSASDEDDEIVEVEDDDDDAEEALDEETLTAMSLRDLRVICEDMEIDHEGMNKPAMVRSIIEASEK